MESKAKAWVKKMRIGALLGSGACLILAYSIAAAGHDSLPVGFYGFLFILSLLGVAGIFLGTASGFQRLRQGSSRKVIMIMVCVISGFGLFGQITEPREGFFFYAIGSLSILLPIIAVAWYVSSRLIAFNQSQTNADGTKPPPVPSPTAKGN